MKEVNATKQYSCTFQKDLKSMKRPRYCHQTAVVQNPKNTSSTTFILLAIGGKHSANDWTNTVEMIDLAPYFKENLTVMDKSGNKVKADSEWEPCAPMKHARSNFAAINLGNRVYVFGGITN